MLEPKSILKKPTSEAEKAQQAKLWEKKLFKIQETLIGEPTQADLDAAIPILPVDRFEEVEEERAACGMCGYPLCRNEIGKVGNKITVPKYRVTGTGKILDISRDYMFCSEVRIPRYRSCTFSSREGLCS